MPPALVIHGHFYQPPRENPWTGVIDDQFVTPPYSNWNERIYYECYRPNAFARVFELQTRRIENIVNNFSLLSFNVGPTLMGWIKRYHPNTYQRILEADRESLKRNNGHGNAIAQAYNHAILPLCNETDLFTQIKWGIADFKHHFHRDPEAMWLPETACNDATLSALIQEGLKFTILSPDQAQRVRPLLGGGEWKDVSHGNIDIRRPYRYFHRDGSGRFIDLFFYDMGIARGVAFEGILVSSQSFLDRIQRVNVEEGGIVHSATDGESYGHHTKFGDLSLAYALGVEAERNGYWVTNYGAYLEKNPPDTEVEIKAGEGGLGTSWSCAHGVGRWWRDCSCQTGGKADWKQAWREPLRRAFDFLRDRVSIFFEEQRGKLFQDPWAARNDYIQLVLDPHASRRDFLEQRAGRTLSDLEQVAALTHLEIQRNAMLMYTSCGWFFTEISGIETVQVMKYAARIFDLLDTLGLASPEADFVAILSEAKSNIPEYGNGAEVYHRFAEPSRVTPQGVVAHLAISTLVNHLSQQGEAGGHYYELQDCRKEEHGRFSLVTGHVLLLDAMTNQHYRYAFAGIHLGGIDFYGAVRPFLRQANFEKSAKRLWDEFNAISLPKLLRLMQEEFGPEEFGVEHLLPESRQKIFGEVFGSLVERFSEQYVRLYEDNRRNLEMLQSVGFELPVEIRAAAEFTFGKLFVEKLEKKDWFLDPDAYRDLISLAEEVTRHGYRVDRFIAENKFRNMVGEIVRRAVEQPTTENLGAASAVVQLTKKLGLQQNLSLAQEALFEAAEKTAPFDRFIELSDLLELKTELLVAKNNQSRG